MQKYLKLIRVRQWYKNLVVFLAILFSGNLFSVDMLTTTIFAFIALCLMSSTNYVLNDYRDVDGDRLHPERKHRPLAAGTVSLKFALFIVILLFISSIVISLYVGPFFLAMVLSLFILTQIYTFYLKNILFADVLTIASLFVIRAISGALAIDVKVSPWLILCPFFLALFLAISKRYANVLLLKKNAKNVRSVLLGYKPELTRTLMAMSTTLLVISYSLYSFLSDYYNLLLTLPFALFVMFRYYYLATEGHEIARRPEKAIKDTQLMAGILLWVVLVVGIIYVF